MYLKIVIIALFYFTQVSIAAPIDTEENEENTQLLDYYQSRGEEAFEFKYELSDGQMREERIHYDDLDTGIAVKGSYKIELDNGEMQTIYYISDARGHRISVNVPFTEEQLRIRPAPTRKPQNHSENRRKFQLAVDEIKSYEENRIEATQRQGRIQESRKIDIPKVEVKAKSEIVAKPVEEVVEEVKTADVKVEDEIKSEETKDEARVNDEIQTEDDDKPEDQVDEEEKPEHDEPEHTEESAKDDDYDAE
ncbi:gelsolin-related protein of 125 kDa-like [Chironomus tepperi]|uniref:gelsolin-related protein of 125 kDa-like n=1 Tax=Chironomus tepperi TaxID=113505 RepID=UPI00391F5ED6